MVYKIVDLINFNKDLTSDQIDLSFCNWLLVDYHITAYNKIKNNNPKFKITQILQTKHKFTDLFISTINFRTQFL